MKERERENSGSSSFRVGSVHQLTDFKLELVGNIIETLI